MTASHPDPGPGQRFSRLAAVPDRRPAPGLVLLFFGAILARGRRTVTTWSRAAGLSGEFRPCYTTVAAAGEQADRVAARLALAAVKPLVADARRLTLALDDTPTERYGPHVQGAGVHHNPPPGPAGSPYHYGHIFVVLGLLGTHPAWGTTALPLPARLYVRKTDLPGIDPQHRPPFRTELELGVELLRWAKAWLGLPGKPLWVVAAGAYAKAPFPKPAKSPGLTVVSRLRTDAAVRCVAGPKPPGRRGPAPTYGDRWLALAKRAGQRRGWTSEVFTPYGQPTRKRYKTLVATWRPAGGAMRVVLVEEPAGWVASFCTGPAATVADILAAVADRFALETAFRDCKEVVGAGQLQVRFVRASVGAFHVCLWTYTMTEAWAWGRPAGELVDRSASPWDDPNRRPSHADKRRAWRRELLGEEIRAVLRPGVTEAGFQAAAERLLGLAA